MISGLIITKTGGMFWVGSSTEFQSHIDAVAANGSCLARAAAQIVPVSDVDVLQAVAREICKREAYWGQQAAVMAELQGGQVFTLT